MKNHYLLVQISDIMIDKKCTECDYREYLVGDCNDDSTIDTTDLAQLKLFLAKPEAEVGEGADLNDDGSIDTSDLAMLKLKLAGF